MLEVRSLTKCYSSVPAVDDVSFTVKPGEVLGYLGPNGSGKSTTVKIITGLLEPTSGSVFFNGSNIKHDLAGYKRIVGYVPEEANLYPFLSGSRVFGVGGAVARFAGKDNREARECVARAVLDVPASAQRDIRLFKGHAAADSSHRGFDAQSGADYFR